MNGEHFEPINDQIKVCVTKEHTFGTDAFLLVHFAGVKDTRSVCDLGAGCGILPALILRNRLPKEIYALEIQEEAYRLALRTAEESGLGDVVRPVLCDFRALPSIVPLRHFDSVVCNPPYYREKAGRVSENMARQVARHETECTIGDVCEAAAKLLKFGGELCLCCPPERLADVFEAMRRYDIEPNRLRLVQQCEGKTPWLALVKGKRGARPGLVVEPPFILESEEGERLYQS